MESLIPKKPFVPTNNTLTAVVASSVREVLKGYAKQGQKVTYGILMAHFQMNRFELAKIMDYIITLDYIHQEPLLTSLVVNKHTGTCGDGFAFEVEKRFKDSIDQGLGLNPSSDEDLYKYAVELGEETLHFYNWPLIDDCDCDDKRAKTTIEFFQQKCFEYYKEGRDN